MTIHGELVHNQAVQDQLVSLGFRFTPERGRDTAPATPRVVLTAHGVSDRERQRLLDAGKELIDTSCPLVRRVHDAARLLQRQGYFVIVLGKPGHVEVEGIVGDLEDYAVVHRLEDFRRFERPRLGVVCQSTTPPREALRLLHAIQALNSDREIRFIATICRPTRERQYAALALFRQVEAVVVVGGRNSNNTLQLVHLAQEHGLPVWHVQLSEELLPALGFARSRSSA